MDSHPVQLENGNNKAYVPHVEHINETNGSNGAAYTVSEASTARYQFS